MPATVLIPAGWLAMIVIMAGLWVVQRRIRDAGVVDVGWTWGVGALAVSWAALADGLPERRLLVALLAGLWSARLGWHILSDRVLKGDEDGRYARMREDWGEVFDRRMLGFFQAQGVLAVVFALPALVAATVDRPALGLLDALAVAVWVVAIGGEWLADRQLARHKADPANRGRTCRRGLWRTSRHPNYFFEWLHWWSYAILAIGSPWWWVPVAAAVLMLYFVVFLTGIPPTERRALESRGEDYRRYQRETSAFVPWFPKESAGG